MKPPVHHLRRKEFEDLFWNTLRKVRNSLSIAGQRYTGRGSQNYDNWFSEAVESMLNSPCSERKTATVITVVNDAVNCGYYVDGYLKRLREIAGLRGEETVVKQGEKRLLDFSVTDLACAEGLESHIAVASRSLRQGTLAHMTLLEDPDEFMFWFSENAGKYSDVYVVGGLDMKGCESIDRIKYIFADMKRRKYRISDQDILSRPGESKDLRILTSGIVQVTTHHKHKTPYGEEKVPVKIVNLLPA